MVIIYSNFYLIIIKGNNQSWEMHTYPQNVPILKPIMVFSKRLDMQSISVIMILLQYQRQILSENFIIISKEQDKFDKFISLDEGLFERNM